QTRLADEAPATGDGADVPLEVLDLVPDARPVQRSHVRIREDGCTVDDDGGARGEGALHGDGLTRTIREHPGHAVGQGLRVAAVAGAPAGFGHQARGSDRVRL